MNGRKSKIRNRDEALTKLAAANTPETVGARRFPAEHLMANGYPFGLIGANDRKRARRNRNPGH